MRPQLVHREKDIQRGSRDHNNRTIGKRDPRALVWTEKDFTDRPIRSLVLSPIGMDLSSNIRW
jgi:hypothetical protein